MQAALDLELAPLPNEDASASAGQAPDGAAYLTEMDTATRRADPNGWRTALGWIWRVALLVPVLFIAAVAVYVLGIAGERLGWLTAPLLLGAGGGALAWLLFLRHPQRTIAVVTVAVLGLGIGAALGVATPMMPSRLAGAIASVDLPDGTALVDARGFGNAACFDSCPSLIHRYEVPGAAADVEQAFAAAFRADGWTLTPEPYVPRSFTALSADAAIEATVTVAPTYAGEPGEEPHERAPTVAPGHVLVEINVRENPCPPGAPGCP